MQKWAYFVFILGFVWAYPNTTVTNCLWHNNTCVESCPEGMVERKSNCQDNYWPALRTCESPEVTLVGTVCGFSRCDCPDNMVFDNDTGYCYEVDNCPTNHRRYLPK